MRRCVLDGRKIKNREMLHDALAAGLHLPKWYGRNLDALYDCLTDLQEETEIWLLQEEELGGHLGSYGEMLKKVLQDGARENAKIVVRV